MKLLVLISLLLSFSAKAQVTQANFQSGQSVNANEINNMFNFILNNSYKKEEVLITYTGSGLTKSSNHTFDLQTYNNVLYYDNELIEGDSSLITSSGKQFIIVNKDNTTVTLTATIYDSNADGVNYYIHHHKDGVQEKSFSQHFTGIHGGKSTHERVLSRTVIANSGDRLLIATDSPNMSRYHITVKATNFTKLSDIPMN